MHVNVSIRESVDSLCRDGVGGQDVSPCRMSPWTSCPRAQCPPTLVMLDRMHKGAVERTGWVEVLSSIEDAL